MEVSHGGQKQIITGRRHASQRERHEWVEQQLEQLAEIRKPRWIIRWIEWIEWIQWIVWRQPQRKQRRVDKWKWWLVRRRGRSQRIIQRFRQQGQDTEHLGQQRNRRIELGQWIRERPSKHRRLYRFR
jgi:hypothetical protein